MGTSNEKKAKVIQKQEIHSYLIRTQKRVPLTVEIENISIGPNHPDINDDNGPDNATDIPSVELAVAVLQFRQLTVLCHTKLEVVEMSDLPSSMDKLETFPRLT